MEYKINCPRWKTTFEVKLVNRHLEFYDGEYFICDLTDEDIKTNIKVDNKVESFIKILDSENIKFEYDELYSPVLKYISGSLIMWVTFDSKHERELCDLILDNKKLNSENKRLELKITELKVLIDKITFERNVFKTKSEFLQEDIDILKHKYNISEI
jgi:hypothetical protein